MSEKEIKPVSRKSDLVTQEHEKEILIYDLLIDKAYSLNETSSLIWNLCDGKNSVAEISSNLSKKLNSSVNEDFVWLALEQLKKDNLLANGEDISIDFGGLSRREVIRKAGFTTLILLPVISSVVSPIAIQAASVSCSGNCRCPNSTAANGSCNGSAATVGGISYVNCFTTSGNNSNCNCFGPFNANNSAGTGFKSSIGGCRI